MRRYLAAIGDGDKVWLSGKLDKDAGEILSIKFGRSQRRVMTWMSINESKDLDTTRLV